MLTDYYGNPLSTGTGLARDNYDIGLRAFLSANYGAEEAFSQAVEADPNFALAYLGLARSFMSSGQLKEAKIALKNAKNVLDGVTEREKSHFLCCELILSGASAKAKANLAHTIRFCLQRPQIPSQSPRRRLRCRSFSSP